MAKANCNILPEDLVTLAQTLREVREAYPLGIPEKLSNWNARKKRPLNAAPDPRGKFADRANKLIHETMSEHSSYLARIAEIQGTKPVDPCPNGWQYGHPTVSQYRKFAYVPCKIFLFGTPYNLGWHHDKIDAALCWDNAAFYAHKAGFFLPEKPLNFPGHYDDPEALPAPFFYTRQILAKLNALFNPEAITTNDLN